MKIKILMLCCFMFLGLAVVGLTQGNIETASQTTVPTVSPPAPPGNLKAKDTPNDNGHSITLNWDVSADDASGNKSVLGYKILRSTNRDSAFVERGVAPSGNKEYTDVGGASAEENDFMPNNSDYYYKLRAITADSTVFADTPVFGPVQTTGQWFNMGRTIVLIFVVGFMILMLSFISAARRGVNLFVRRLAGIEAVDEAIGRATEMGKPILYVLGLGTAADIATIAAFTILGRVAKKVAEYQTGLICTVQ